MRLTIAHETEYRFDSPIQFGLQELRMTPKSRAGQTVLRWQTTIDGGEIEARFEDHNNNQVALIGLAEGAERVVISCEGEIETADAAGVVGRHGGFAPLWYFQRETPLTRPGAKIRALARQVGDVHDSDLARLHALMAAIAEAAPYRTGATLVDATAEDALADGGAVCQDHAHIFVSAARTMGYPARYVSGYLKMDDREAQDATHAWAEAHVTGLGWVGFDVSNAMSPDDGYVRVATGLDYKEAAPVSGIIFGATEESLSVSIRVAT